MSAKTPTVSAHWVYDPAQPAAGIRLDTPAWLAWLDAETTTRFAYPVFDPAHGYLAGFMTVRKEQRQRGGRTGWRIAAARDACARCTWAEQRR
jgi:hypothetical protein